MFGGLCVDNVWLQSLSRRVLKCESFQIKARMFFGPKALEGFSFLITALSLRRENWLVLMFKRPEARTVGRV